MVVTSLYGINGWSIQTLLRGENDLKQLDEIQAILGWDWKNHLVKKCNYSSLHYQVGGILDDKSLVQLVEEPTRQQNTLDLAITNQPIIIRNVCIFPGVSDTSKDPTFNKRANWDSLADELTKDIDTITTIAQFNSIQFFISYYIWYLHKCT